MKKRKPKIDGKDWTYVSCLVWTQGPTTTRVDCSFLRWPRPVKILGFNNLSTGGGGATIRVMFPANVTLYTLGVGAPPGSTNTSVSLSANTTPSVNQFSISLGVAVSLFFPVPIVTNYIEAVCLLANAAGNNLTIYYKF